MNFNALKNGEVSREGLERLAVEEVTRGNLDDRELVEDIQLCDVKAGVAVDHGRVLDDHHVQPTAAALAAGGDTKLEANALEVLANVVELLGGEGTATDTGGIGLDDTNDLLDSGGRDTETGADTTDGSVGRGHVGVGTKVQIEHKGVSAFDEDFLARLVSLVHVRDTVGDVGAEALGQLTVAGQLALDIVLEMAVPLALVVDHDAELGGKLVKVVQVMHAQTGAGGLGRVGRTNALLGGTDAATAELDLLETVDDLVEIKDEVRTVRDVQTLVAVETFFLGGGGGIVRISSNARHVIV